MVRRGIMLGLGILVMSLLVVPVFAEKLDIEIGSSYLPGELEIKCAEGSNNQEVSISIPRGMVEITEIINEKDGLNISYAFDNSEVVGEGVVVEIWLVDERGNEIKRMKDGFSINKEGLIERNIKMELPSSLVGIYNIYFALDSDLEDFVKQSVVLGDSSSTTGFAIFDTPWGDVVAYIIFLLVILIGVLFIWKRHKKKSPYTHKHSKGKFWRKHKK
tara:strand:+ start:357 stop:1007 length:651 start_codon:yes stop_codon:yes gene_type:complete